MEAHLPAFSVRPLLLALALLPLAACDSRDEPFSVEVHVESASGAALAGYDVVLGYGDYEDLFQRRQATARAAAAMRVSPTLWSGYTTVRYNLSADVAAARVRLVGLDGTAVAEQAVSPAAGSYAVVFGEDAVDEIPGGIYRFVGTFGADEAEVWTLHADVPGDWIGSRWLSLTDAAGMVRTDDRTAAPWLGSPPPIEIIDSRGDSYGTYRVDGEDVVVAVFRNGEQVASQAVDLRDGANRVTVRVATD